MSAARRIVLLRHGRTGHNADGLMQGQLDVELDVTGQQQAASAAAALAGARPAVLVSSDLSRARETAAPIGAAMVGDDVEDGADVDRAVGQPRRGRSPRPP